uniref:Uncharacterized protein n=1 Tax=Rhizophora mucronata TaxID=61149 RepID=A0A2P2NRH1_RHIMU
MDKRCCSNIPIHVFIPQSYFVHNPCINICPCSACRHKCFCLHPRGRGDANYREGME